MFFEDVNYEDKSCNSPVSSITRFFVRFIKYDEITKMILAITNTMNESGRSKKMNRLPDDISSDWIKEISIFGPNTRQRINGIMGQLYLWKK